MTSRRLSVMLYGSDIGWVTQSASGGHTFAYHPDYIATSDPTPLSLSMPVTAGIYPRRRIVPFLQGLLPDSEVVLDRWGRELSVNGRNPFALLERMGMECAGAVQFRTEQPELLTEQNGLEPISDRSIGRRLAALRSDDSAWVVSGDRWSLAGAQGKFALARGVDGTWFEPRGYAPSTHILKPGVVGYREQALNEHACLTAAASLGLTAARTEYLEFDGEPALIVARYDRRRTDDGSIVRVHQEDMCQALSVYPRLKYESSGGPTAARVAELLWQVATDAERDVMRFVDAVVFNYLIGAPDAHAKNYSVLLVGSQVQLAPIYDIASGLPYEATSADSELDRSAMAIGGKRIFGTVQGRHWDRFAAACKVPTDAVRASVARIAADLPAALEQAFEPYAGNPLRERLLAKVSALGRQTVRDL